MGQGGGILIQQPTKHNYDPDPDDGIDEKSERVDALIAYAAGVPLRPDLNRTQLREAIVASAKKQNRINVLAGEIMRRKPSLL